MFAPIIVAGFLIFHSQAVGAEGTVVVHDSPASVKMALQWKPQGQFAGYYMARDKGFYEGAGVAVTILHADADHNSMQMLKDGVADIATAFLSDGMIAYPEVVQIAQIVQRSNLMLVAWKKRGVSRPSDLVGKQVSYWKGAFSTAFDAFFDLHQIQVVPIPQYYSITLFLKEGVDACAAMEYNEFHQVWQAGIDADRIKTFLLRDYGLDFPEDGMYAEKQWAERNRDAAIALREATLAGWRYAREHPEEALDVVLKEARKAGVPANRPHERWMLGHILDSIFMAGKPDDHAGRLGLKAFENTVTILASAGFLPSLPEFSTFAPFQEELP